MSELKTLKDISHIKRDCCSEVPKGESNICIDCVKQEAIKWVKNWKEINEKAHSNEIYAFETFFNIEESDLK